MAAVVGVSSARGLQTCAKDRQGLLLEAVEWFYASNARAKWAFKPSSCCLLQTSAVPHHSFLDCNAVARWIARRCLRMLQMSERCKRHHSICLLMAVPRRHPFYLAWYDCSSHFIIEVRACERRKISGLFAVCWPQGSRYTDDIHVISRNNTVKW